MKKQLCIIRKKITPEMVGHDCFVPVNGSDFDMMKKCSYKKPILCASKRSRNPEHHNLIFALAECAIDNVPAGSKWAGRKPYELIKAIMIEWDMIQWKLNLDGTVRPEAESISFESKSEEEFESVSHAVFTECAKILKVTVEELKENYAAYL